MRDREQSINTISPCLLDCFRAPPRRWKLWLFSRSQQSSSGFTDERGHILSVGGDALRRAFLPGDARTDNGSQVYDMPLTLSLSSTLQLFRWRRQQHHFSNLPTANTQTHKCLWFQTQAHTRWFINPILSHTNLHNNTRQSVWSMSSCSGKHVSWN